VVGGQNPPQQMPLNDKQNMKSSANYIQMNAENRGNAAAFIRNSFVSVSFFRVDIKLYYLCKLIRLPRLLINLNYPYEKMFLMNVF